MKNQKFATIDQIKLLRHDFFRNFICDSTTPYELLQDELHYALSSQLLDRPSKSLYPLELSDFVSLLKHDEACYVLHHLSASRNNFRVWGTYVPCENIDLVTYVLTEPDPDNSYAVVLNESNSTGLLRFECSEAETGHPHDDSLTIKRLCKRWCL